MGSDRLIHRPMPDFFNNVEVKTWFPAIPAPGNKILSNGLSYASDLPCPAPSERVTVEKSHGQHVP
jgi:hypothetical protein